MDQEQATIYGYGNAGQFYDHRPSFHDLNRDHHPHNTNGSGSSSLPSTSSSSLGYIEHHVSKFDTLAGIAIKYGVEVADIKRLNGLVTDIQMFALKAIHIPLPGRHPPSNCLSTSSEDIAVGDGGSEHAPPHHPSNIFDGFQSLRLKPSQQTVSPLMGSLQDYYGLESKDYMTKSGILEMTVHRMGDPNYLEVGQFMRTTIIPTANRPLSQHRKSKSLVMNFLDDKGEVAADHHMLKAEEESSLWIENLVRRRQKSESNFTTITTAPETVLKEDLGSAGFSATAGKSLALTLRSKVTSRAADGDMHAASGIWDPMGTDSNSLSFSVRKSSSTSNLHEQEISSFSSTRSTSKWSFKPDSPSAAIIRPIFDGLPKPLSIKRNKAAVD